MTTTSFKLSTHGITGRSMVEIYDGEELIGAIYEAENAIHIVSDHFESEPLETASKGMLPVPGWLVKFKTERVHLDVV